jgi:hypothetical protein
MGGPKLKTPVTPKQIQMSVYHEKMSTIPGQKGNANQNHTKIPPQSCYNSYQQEYHQQERLVRMQLGLGEDTLIHCWWECKLV